MKLSMLVIVGPTASGKTSLSIDLAQTYQGEIISADSMQVYRGMDIGTAKITSTEQRGVPHHLLDVCDPDATFSVRTYQELALKKISEIHERDHLPILVGGTGLYVEAVTYGYQLPAIPENPVLRNELEEWATRYGKQALHNRLRLVDPLSAERIHPNNVRRVIRALEVTQQTGNPFSTVTQKKKARFSNLLWIGLTMPRVLLYERINQRVDQMIDQGLLQEVQRLIKQGYHQRMTAMQAIGYKELTGVLAGKIPLTTAVEQIKQHSRNYAKRQLTWFRRLKEIHWFDVSKENAYEEIQRWVAGEFIANRE